MTGLTVRPLRYAAGKERGRIVRPSSPASGSHRRATRQTCRRRSLRRIESPPCASPAAAIAATSPSSSTGARTAEIPARACTCTFCTRHGGVWTSCPAARSACRAGSVAHVRPTLRHGHGRVHVCTRCGVVPVVTSLVDGAPLRGRQRERVRRVDPALLRHVIGELDGETESTAWRVARATGSRDVAFESGN